MNWPDLYGLVATGAGYTWSEIDAMSLSALRELLDYWSRHPPAHLLLAAVLRVTPKPKPVRAAFAGLAALAPDGTLTVTGTNSSPVMRKKNFDSGRSSGA